MLMQFLGHKTTSSYWCGSLGGGGLNQCQAHTQGIISEWWSLSTRTDPTDLTYW